ncbi:hypothetical protein DCE79_07905 [Lysinibacillus sp. 2017]|uniref:hypothetical protein n=1 Tax=unclassified Lysinibacillus TaxID=2636778 RepID=UPI000D528BC7|nr:MULTISPECIES: hypothetical protein [unclassified Lysinibacillus]AWE07303.1 hypothetical protein DCE79_07905 [Lysinibacillus sp. 2017]TGN32071.1 hypothetical protein E4L99_16145 [Lysinibacillus sp. S2017]
MNKYSVFSLTTLLIFVVMFFTMFSGVSIGALGRISFFYALQNSPQELTVVLFVFDTLKKHLLNTFFKDHILPNSSPGTNRDEQSIPFKEHSC